MAENVKVIKVVGEVFLMIKNGPGFMVSQMHSLFNKVVDNGTLELTYEIATKMFYDKLLIIWASRPNIETVTPLPGTSCQRDSRPVRHPRITGRTSQQCNIMEIITQSGTRSATNGLQGHQGMTKYQS